MKTSRDPAPQQPLGQVLKSLRNPELVRSKGCVNGEWVGGQGGKRFAVVGESCEIAVSLYRVGLTRPIFFPDPATNEELAEVACMGQEEAHEAIAAAYVAQHRWKNETPPVGPTNHKLTAGCSSSHGRVCA
jgi:hypothetical protein